jgi:hypothetical protein
MDHLPIEIILDVLSISEPDTIATFLRTASKYRDAAQPLLYDRIILKGPKPLQGLVESLAAKPQFAPRVRHLTALFVGGGYYDSDIMRARYYALAPLLEKTENLESLVLYGFHEGIYLASPLLRLRNVECDSSHRYPRAVFFLSMLPNLCSITLRASLQSWTNNTPPEHNAASLERIWADVLKKVTTYSGPPSVLSSLPQGSSLKHIQTAALEGLADSTSLDRMREATDGGILSLECTPLPLHPPSFGLYFPNIRFLGLFQIMTIPPQPVWVRGLLPVCNDKGKC